MGFSCPKGFQIVRGQFSIMSLKNSTVEKPTPVADDRHTYLFKLAEGERLSEKVSKKGCPRSRSALDVSTEVWGR